MKDELFTKQEPGQSKARNNVSMNVSYFIHILRTSSTVKLKLWLKKFLGTLEYFMFGDLSENNKENKREIFSYKREKYGQNLRF